MSAHYIIEPNGKPLIQPKRMGKLDRTMIYIFIAGKLYPICGTRNGRLTTSIVTYDAVERCTCRCRHQFILVLCAQLDSLRFILGGILDLLCRVPQLWKISDGLLFHGFFSADSAYNRCHCICHAQAQSISNDFWLP